MIFKKLIFLSFFAFLLFDGLGQSTLPQLEKEMAFYADVMVNASHSEHRKQALDKFNNLFEEALAQPGAYDYPFETLVWISKKEPEDQSFKIYTWEAGVETGEYKYFGTLITKSGKIYPLNDQFKEAIDLATEEFTYDDWLGAVYYNLMEEKTSQGQKYYLLYGVNRWSQYETVKLVDVLFFDKDEVPYFGLPIFEHKDRDGSKSYTHRLLYRYSSDSQMTVNYNPGMKMIMVDNLVRKMSRIPGQSETYVPDGTYVGYELKKGVWQKIEQIAIEPMETAPRPKPILDKRKGTNIFGK